MRSPLLHPLECQGTNVSEEASLGQTSCSHSTELNWKTSAIPPVKLIIAVLVHRQSLREELNGRIAVRLTTVEKINISKAGELTDD